MFNLEPRLKHAAIDNNIAAFLINVALSMSMAAFFKRDFRILKNNNNNNQMGL